MAMTMTRPQRQRLCRMRRQASSPRHSLPHFMREHIHHRRCRVADEIGWTQNGDARWQLCPHRHNHSIYSLHNNYRGQCFLFAHKVRHVRLPRFTVFVRSMRKRLQHSSPRSACPLTELVVQMCTYRYFHLFAENTHWAIATNVICSHKARSFYRKTVSLLQHARISHFQS